LDLLELGLPDLGATRKSAFQRQTPRPIGPGRSSSKWLPLLDSMRTLGTDPDARVLRNWMRELPVLESFVYAPS
jgi:hypothetical protein